MGDIKVSTPTVEKKSKGCCAKKEKSVGAGVSVKSPTVTVEKKSPGGLFGKKSSERDQGLVTTTTTTVTTKTVKADGTLVDKKSTTTKDSKNLKAKTSINN